MNSVFVFFEQPVPIDRRMDEIIIPANSCLDFMYVTPFLSYYLDDS